MALSSKLHHKQRRKLKEGRAERREFTWVNGGSSRRPDPRGGALRSRIALSIRSVIGVAPFLPRVLRKWPVQGQLSYRSPFRVQSAAFTFF